MTRPARKMKPSGIPWIGDVPTDWEVMRLKDVATLNPQTHILLNENDRVSFVPMECLRTGNIEKRERLYSEVAAYTPFLENDILVAKVTPCFENKNIAIAQNLTNKIGFASSEIFIFRQKSINSKFLFYLLLSEYIAAIGVSSMTGTGGLKRVNTNIATCKVPVPPVETQKKIAEFLDEKCAEIDALIAVEEKMIAELKSYKQSVITEAVTRGVPAAENAARPLKDSGIPWLGSVPAHWETRKIKTLGILQGGNGFPEEFQGCVNESIPFIKVKSLSENPIARDGKDTISKTTRANLKAIVIPPNSVVFAKVGAALLLHRFRKLEFSTCIDNNMMAFIPCAQILPDFFVYAACLLDFSLFVNPGTVPSVNQEQVGNICIPCPNIETQHKIVKFLDLKTKKIDSMISLKQEKITTLQNYKKSIIFEYVTGKESA